MFTISFYIFFIFILAFILLGLNLLLAPNNPYQEKDSVFECGFHSFLGQNRTQFAISFFVFALLFLLFDLEILLVYPYVVSAYSNGIYGLVIMLIFFLVLTLGFAFELGKKALNIDTRQSSTTLNNSKNTVGLNTKFTIITSLSSNSFYKDYLNLINKKNYSTNTIRLTSSYIKNFYFYIDQTLEKVLSHLIYSFIYISYILYINLEKVLYHLIYNLLRISLWFYINLEKVLYHLVYSLYNKSYSFYIHEILKSMLYNIPLWRLAVSHCSTYITDKLLSLIKTSKIMSNIFNKINNTYLPWLLIKISDLWCFLNKNRDLLIFIQITSILFHLCVDHDDLFLSLASTIFLIVSFISTYFYVYIYSVVNWKNMSRLEKILIVILLFMIASSVNILLFQLLDTCKSLLLTNGEPYFPGNPGQGPNPGGPQGPCGNGPQGPGKNGTVCVVPRTEDRKKETWFERIRKKPAEYKDLLERHKLNKQRAKRKKRLEKERILEQEGSKRIYLEDNQLPRELPAEVDNSRVIARLTLENGPTDKPVSCYSYTKKTKIDYILNK